MSIFLADVPNRFALPVPSPGWLQAIEDYDADLVLLPSQTAPVFRLARKARRSGGMSGRQFSALPGLHADTREFLRRQLVAVTTVPREALLAPPSVVVAQLRARDQWRVGGGSDEAGADRVSDLLEGQDVQRELAVARERQDGLRVRARAMRVGYLHRTGARVSLVRPTRSVAADHPSPPAPDSSVPARGEVDGAQPAGSSPR